MRQRKKRALKTGFTGNAGRFAPEARWHEFEGRDGAARLDSGRRASCRPPPCDLQTCLTVFCLEGGIWVVRDAAVQFRECMRGVLAQVSQA